MKEIFLTQGKIALVDDEDYEYLSQYKWCAHEEGRTWYALRNVRINGKRTILRMHHNIIGRILGYEVDHINGNGLDNQRNNLRHVTHRQNHQNRHHPKSSIYPGVYWDRGNKKWRTLIQINGSRKHLGLFTNENKAFLVYKKEVDALGGKFV